MELKLPQPISRDYDHLVRDIRSGICQLPRFQRDFVWDKQQAASLIDSIIKGFPIGAFILWKTKERMGAYKRFGGVVLETPPESDFVHYVLDGQQRLTSLFLAAQGIALNGGNPDKDYKRLYADLNPEKSWDGDDELCVTEKPTAGIPIHQLVAGDWAGLRELEDRHGRKAADLANRMRESIARYKFATIEVQDLPLETVAEMFTRINTGGRELTLFEIVNAKVYQEGDAREGEGARRAFDLEEEIDNLTEELEQVSYDTLTQNKTVVLQAAAAIIGRDVRKKTILKINRSAFVDEWDEAAECLRLAVDKMRDYFRVEASKLLPYPSMLAPIAYFYRLNEKRQPDNAQMRQISRFFFRAAFSRRYSSAVEAKLNQDLRLMEKIAERKPVDVAKAIPLDNETNEFFVQQLMRDFRSSDAFAKAVLCIMAERGPKRLSDNAPVRLDNSGLHRSTSMNYHHFFPKSRVRKDSRANALANIILVDDYLNKRVIGNKMPSAYIGKFGRENPDVADALDSHFVGMEDFVDDSGKDDFGKFLEKRAHRLARVILRKIGKASEDAASEIQPELAETAESKPKRQLSPDSAPKEGVVILEGWHLPPPGSARRGRRVAVETIKKEKGVDIDSRIIEFAGQCLPDLLVVKDGNSQKSWATHKAAMEVLLGKAKRPDGLQDELQPGLDDIRPSIRAEFWQRAPAKARPSPDGKNAIPYDAFGKPPVGEWGVAWVAVASPTSHTTKELAGAHGGICHFPTLSFFRFWDDDPLQVMSAHRGDAVKTDKQWKELLSEAPKQRKKLEALMEAHPDL